MPLIYAYGGTSADPREIYGFQMIANAARHGTYGINGNYFGYGNGIIRPSFRVPCSRGITWPGVSLALSGRNAGRRSIRG